MSRCVLSSVLLLTTLLQSTQPCCAQSFSFRGSCCDAATDSECDTCDGRRSCVAGTCQTAGAQSVNRQLRDASKRDSSPETRSPHPLPAREQRKCPTCNGELPNPVTKTGALKFLPGTVQETPGDRLAVDSQNSARLSDTPHQDDRSRIRSPGHLRI